MPVDVSFVNISSVSFLCETTNGWNHIAFTLSKLEVKIFLSLKRI